VTLRGASARTAMCTLRVVIVRTINTLTRNLPSFPPPARCARVGQPLPKIENPVLKAGDEEDGAHAGIEVGALGSGRNRLLARCWSP
jgi:hypothetical protein